jgi:putative nucleotidyltransferase with HDIG domain
MHNLNQPLTVIAMRSHLMSLAIEKGPVDAAEMKRSLRDIQNFAVEIGEMLRNVAEPSDFVTEAYVGGTRILDVERAGSHTTSLRTACMAALEAILAALDSRSPGALEHARGTSEMARQLAMQMGLEESAAVLAGRAGMLHDIGKIGVPDEVLRKPEKLTAPETGVMRRHVEAGYEIVRAFPLLQEEAEIVWAHHEWYNGSGYPRGIGGNEIPLEARIVAVADVFDALRHNRSYRHAESLAQATTKIEADAGKHFDPDVVRVLGRSCAADAKTFRRRAAEPQRATQT